MYLMYFALTAVFLLYHCLLCSSLGEEFYTNCSMLENRPCKMRCPINRSIDCSQICGDVPETCTMECPDSSRCMQTCNGKDKCKTINCSSKECYQRCEPSCKYVECINNEKCYQIIEDIFQEGVSSSTGFCSSNFCSQSCIGGICTLTCDALSGVCAQIVSRSPTQSVCNARSCYQSCFEGECELECQRDAPNNENCTQNIYDKVWPPYEGWLPSESPEEEQMEDNARYSAYDNTNSTVFYNTTSIEELGVSTRRLEPIKMKASCYGKRCDQICNFNQTCSFDCRNGDVCYQRNSGENSTVSGQCSSKRCFQSCFGPGNCDYTCRGKECYLTCSSTEKLNKTCTLRCEGHDVALCNMKCTGYSECIMDCGKSKKCDTNGKLSFSHAAIWQATSFMIYMVLLAQIYIHRL